MTSQDAPAGIHDEIFQVSMSSEIPVRLLLDFPFFPIF